MIVNKTELSNQAKTYLKQQLRKITQETDVSAYRIAKDTGFSRQLVKDWIDGDRCPSAANLYVMACYFNKPISYFFQSIPYQPVESTNIKEKPEWMDLLSHIADDLDNRIGNNIDSVLTKMIAFQNYLMNSFPSGMILPS